MKAFKFRIFLNQTQKESNENEGESYPNFQTLLKAE